MSRNKYKDQKLYILEDLRHGYAMAGLTDEFLDTYKYREVKIRKNNNTSKFWDGKFAKPESIDSQDQMTKEKITKIISILPKQDINILDLGIGQGFLEQKMMEYGRSDKLFGIDISPISIKRAAKNFSGEFRVGDVLGIEKYYPKNYFDVIVAIELIEHMYPKNILTFYRKVHKLLKPEGILVISTPLNENLRNMATNPSEHVREYTPEILSLELSLSMFKITSRYFLYAFKRQYTLKKLISKILKSRWKPNSIVIVARKK